MKEPHHKINTRDKVNAKSQDVTDTLLTTTMAPLDLKPSQTAETTQNPCSDMSEQPLATPRLLSGSQTSQTMSQNDSTLFKKAGHVVYNPQSSSNQIPAPVNDKPTPKGAHSPTSSPDTLHVTNNLTKAHADDD